MHEAAGLIDVSTLGKLIVRGPDAGEFLDRLYPNRFSNLAPGRIRYGVMASDAGRIMDDGTICRLDDDSFYVTTTSSGAGAVYEWFSWWLADWRLRVHLTDVTQGLSAVNLAGPRAREILASLTELDCSPEGFAYLDGKRAEVAGVPCLLLRIGFVGEVGYELHFPSAHGEHLWDALLEAGTPHGLRPFGLEPQRLLRLQKMHILVGPGHRLRVHAVRRRDALDREARQGPGLHRQVGAREGAPRDDLETTLVGFTLADGHVPTEGAVVLPDGDGPVGQVTSARFSPQLGGVIGMAWVPASLAKDGATRHDLRRGQAARGRGGHEAVLRPRRRGAPLVSFEFLSPAAVGARAQPDGAPGAARRARGSSAATAGTWPSRFDGEHPERERCADSVRLRRPLAPRKDRGAGRPATGLAADQRRALELGWPRARTAPGGARSRPTRRSCSASPPTRRLRLLERARGDGPPASSTSPPRSPRSRSRARSPGRCSRASPPSTCVRRSTPVARLPARLGGRAPRGRSCARASRAG